VPSLLDKLDQTTLILGAGASCAYGYPVGSALRGKLEEVHNSRDPLVESLGHSNSAQYRQTLRDYQAETIDEFLGAYTEHSDRAKAEIAYHLIQCENSYSLMSQGNSDGWYRYFFMDVLGADPMLGSGKVSIISFNYDLSLRVYLYRTLRARTQLEPTEARERLRKLPFVHVHGHIGALNDLHGKGREYDAAAINADALREAVTRMVTIHEEPRKKYWEHAHALLSKSKNLLFLGFGFAEENLKRLELEKHCAGARAFLWPMKCAHAVPRLRAHAPSVKILFHHEKPHESISTTPTLDRARTLFEAAAAPPRKAKSKRQAPPGFGSRNGWMSR